MRILHYSLGFPPYRTGGLTKFCVDIMKQQADMGHEVALLWPGKICCIKKENKILKRSSYEKIKSYELINPLPVPYDEGIAEIDKFVRASDRDKFIEFLSVLKPEVIHVHTLMGLPREFLEVARSMKIHLVFTVHDFYAICPKVKMFRNGKNCDCVDDCNECPICNSTALTWWKIIILQSPCYRYLKDNYFVKILRRRHRVQYFSNERVSNNKTISSNCRPNDYLRLRKYYESMINLMDVVHYNSEMTKKVFERIFKPNKSKVITISHSNIHDHRTEKRFDHQLRLTYLGPLNDAKGYYVLKKALDRVCKKRNVILNLFFNPKERESYMNIHSQYSYLDLEKIFQETDILVAPSIWYETFGYTVLEAISYGVPVLISDHVGAQDIIPEGCGIIINEINEEKLENVIQNITNEKLVKINKNILRDAKITTLEEMTCEVMEVCYVKNNVEK